MGVKVAVFTGTDVEVAVFAGGGGVNAAQVSVLTLFESIVTAPFRARVRPDTVAPVFKVMLVSARMLPEKAVVVPSVAELPICQNALHGAPPLVTNTEEPVAVVIALATLKTQTALGLFCASNTSGPVSRAAEVKQ